MSKMTDKQIKKALKICAKNETPFCCGECELGENNSSCDCVDRLLKLSLDLINRQQEKIEYMQGERETLLEDIKASSNQVIEQQAEIEKLNVELVGMRGACNSYKMHYDNAKVEIERLEKELSTANNHITRLESQIERLLPMLKTKKAEAIKECLDRIEAFLCGVCGSVVEDNPNLDRILFGYNTEEVDAFIDNLRKEMVGEGKWKR